MNIAAEKKDIISRLKQVNDMSLILAFKNLLDFGLSRQAAETETLEDAIEAGMRQSDRRQIHSHKEVMAEVRKKYKA